jgi:hypothetical protein
MDILNKKERYSAFVMFLLMFTITTGVLIFALFFNYRLPVKENEVLKAENEKIIKQFNFQKTFSDKIERVSKLVDSLDKSPDRFPYLEQTINMELVALNTQISNDSLEGKKLYGNVILKITQLVNAKKSMVQLNDSKKTIDKLNSQIEKLQSENDNFFKQVQLLNQMNR